MTSQEQTFKAAVVQAAPVFLDRDGTINKLKPTHAERTVFGEGDGSHLAVHELDIGRLGALNCWEHLQPLTKYAMYSMHEQIHGNTDDWCRA